MTTALGSTDLTFSSAHSCGVANTGRRTSSSTLKVMAAFNLNMTRFGLTNADAVAMLLGTDEVPVGGFAIAVQGKNGTSIADVLPVETGGVASWLSTVQVDAGVIVTLSTGNFKLTEPVGFLLAGNEIKDGFSFKGTVSVQPGDLQDAIKSMFNGSLPLSLPVATRIPYAAFFSSSTTAAAKPREALTTLDIFNIGLGFAKEWGLESNTLGGVAFTISSVADLPALQINTVLNVPQAGGAPGSTIPFKVEHTALTLTLNLTLNLAFTFTFIFTLTL